MAEVKWMSHDLTSAMVAQTGEPQCMWTTVLKLYVMWPVLSAGMCLLQDCSISIKNISKIKYFHVAKWNKVNPRVSEIKFTHIDVTYFYIWPINWWNLKDENKKIRKIIGVTANSGSPMPLPGRQIERDSESWKEFRWVDLDDRFTVIDSDRQKIQDRLSWCRCAMWVKRQLDWDTHQPNSCLSKQTVSRPDVLSVWLGSFLPFSLTKIKLSLGTFSFDWNKLNCIAVKWGKITSRSISISGAYLSDLVTVLKLVLSTSLHSHNREGA